MDYTLKSLCRAYSKHFTTAGLKVGVEPSGDLDAMAFAAVLNNDGTEIEVLKCGFGELFEELSKRVKKQS